MEWIKSKLGLCYERIRGYCLKSLLKQLFRSCVKSATLLLRLLQQIMVVTALAPASEVCQKELNFFWEKNHNKTQLFFPFLYHWCLYQFGRRRMCIVHILKLIKMAQNYFLWATICIQTSARPDVQDFFTNVFLQELLILYGLLKSEI